MTDPLDLAEITEQLKQLMISRFAAGHDPIHLQTAAAMYGIDYEQFKKENSKEIMLAILKSKNNGYK